MKEKPVREHRAWNTRSFAVKADSRFGDPTPDTPRPFQERGLRAGSQPTRKPGAERPERGGGRARWEREAATAAPAEGPANDDGGKPQRRLSVEPAGVGWLP